MKNDLTPTATQNGQKLRVFLGFATTAKASQIVATLPDKFVATIYRDLDSLIGAMTQQSPDIILCDQLLLDNNQAQVLTQIKSVAPTTRILIVGGQRSVDVQIAALKQGARGYFNDETLPISKIYDAIDLIMHGQVWVERRLISGLIDEMNHAPQVDNAHRRALKTLSPKEFEVATLVSHGATNKMIAKNMNITERTVKAHLTMIFQKMNLPDRLSLAIVFRDLRP